MRFASKSMTILVSLGAILLAASGAHAQAPYWAPDTAGRPPGTPPTALYPPGSPYNAAPGTLPGSAAPFDTAPTRGPIVARPFTAEPPPPLIGERMQEEGVDPELVDVQIFTGTIVTEQTIPRVNTLDEYKMVVAEQEPAIYFDGEVFLFHEPSNTYRPRDWIVQERNERIWQEIQDQRQAALDALYRQQYRPAGWRVPPGVGYGQGYPGPAGTGYMAPGAAGYRPGAARPGAARPTYRAPRRR